MDTALKLGRALGLAAASLACGFSSATAALVTLHLSLPPEDGAYGQPLTEVWSDPFVRMVAAPFALLGAALGFAAALGLLWRTRLLGSIPVVFGGTVLVAAIAGPLGLMAPLPTLGYGIWAMLWCRKRFAVVPA
jgi:hypothetical protein